MYPMLVLPPRGSDPADRENGFVKLMETRPEGFKHLSLDGSPGAVEALTEAGVRTRTTDPQHCDLHKDTITGCREQLFQLNPVGMGMQSSPSLATQSHRSQSSLTGSYCLAPHWLVQAQATRWGLQWRPRSDQHVLLPSSCRSV